MTRSIDPRVFYQDGLPADQKKRFRSAPRQARIEDEIALVRLSIHAALPALKAEASLQQKDLLLRAIALLARLIRLQTDIGPDPEDQLAEINEAILRRLEATE